jgi:2'-5' RNA ligase
MFMKGEGYSLWLMPSGEIRDKFSSLIRRLALEYGAPMFEPHVTLLGGITLSEEDVLRKTEKLVSGQSDFKVTLQVVDCQNYYFRALFVKAEKTPLLQVLYDRAREIFGVQDIPDYLPHLSLVYGDFLQAIKEQMIQGVGRSQTAEFTVDRVHLFKTDGEVDTWYRMKEFPFRP